MGALVLQLRHGEAAVLHVVDHVLAAREFQEDRGGTFLPRFRPAVSLSYPLAGIDAGLLAADAALMGKVSFAPALNTSFAVVLNAPGNSSLRTRTLSGQIPVKLCFKL